MDTELTLHKCPDCNRDFKNLGALVSHRRTHKSVEALPPNPSLGALDPDDLPEEFRESLVAKVKQQIMLNAASKKPNAATRVYIRKLPHYGSLPLIARATEGAAGYDLHAAIERNICIGVGERVAIPTGLCVEIPSHMYALIAPRSGLATKKSVTVVNAPGIIDSDYRGEIVCHLINHSNTKFWVEPGMRVAQMIFHEYVVPELVEVNELSNTVRGTGGFGSTGT